MEKLQTVRPERTEEFRKRYHVLLNISDEKINDILKLVDYGRLLPDIWKDKREEEFNRKIAKICQFDDQKASLVMSSIIGILRNVKKKEFVLKRESDLLKLKFNKTEIERYGKLVNTLRKKGGHDEVREVDQWQSLTAEVLPSLASIECSFDIRCGIKKDQVSTYIPIVLLKLRATNEGGKSSEFVFQTDIGTLRRITRVLTETYRNSSVLRKYTLKRED
ncbi:MAG: hypothetical protein WCD81_07475 [Candidatus Bathyarchaeia archaeon]